MNNLNILHCAGSVVVYHAGSVVVIRSSSNQHAQLQGLVTKVKF